MLISSVEKYLASQVKLPFFLFVGDDEYINVLNELNISGLSIVALSSFCNGIDKLPDIDELVGIIESADINANEKRFAVTGLGEYLALRGYEEARRTLSRLKDLNTGTAKVVLLLRGLAPLLAELEADPRFDKRRYSKINKAESSLSFTLVAQSVQLPALIGLKAILIELESGRCGRIVANTAINIEKALFNIYPINNDYEGIKYYISGFSLPRSCGTDALWGELLNELNKSGGDLDEVFVNHGLYGNFLADFYERIERDNFSSWLYFIFLKGQADTLHNSYLSYVLSITSDFGALKYNVLNAIIGIPHADKSFPVFYKERKALIEKFPEPIVAEFIINNRRIVKESIYKLTDNTNAEREEIVAWVSSNGRIPQLDSIYPALSAYLNTYVFKCPELAEQLTEYFEAYKRQKLSNQIEQEFLEKVDELAHKREYNLLPSRDEIISRVDKCDTFLYWLDALGVEYLSLIEDLVHKCGISMQIHIARADLPTITSVNRAFYDSWQGKKDKTRELDDIKHNRAGSNSFTNNEKEPIHLAKELEVIASTIDKAATLLAKRRCKRFIIASDHGASRLAVLRRKEEKYDTETSGEHSGRCCKLFKPYELPFATEENGYIVLADYGRFRGSRAANIEVHGGASLEEVVIPIIELTLKDTNTTVQLVNEVVTVDFNTCIEIELFFNSPVEDITAIVNKKKYTALQLDENHFSVKLHDVKRAGEYTADVYSGDNLIGQLTFKAQGRGGKINDAFDDLFREV